MNNRKSIYLIMGIVIVCTIFSAYFTYNNSKGLLQDEYENELRMESEMISAAIDNCFLRPITVSETMSKDVTMRMILSADSREESIEKEEEAKGYLKSIREGFGYAMSYAVCETTKAFYTMDGICEFIDPESDKNYYWYENYMRRYSEKNTGRKYVLEVDTDAANNWGLSIFVNSGVYDSDGACIGVCGVGVDITEIKRMVERFERIYDVKIHLVDKTGLIMMDADISKIKKESIQIDDLELYMDRECYYEISDNGSRTITYMDNLEWFLVVENTGAWNSNVFSLIMPSIVCMLLGIVLITGVLVYERYFG